MADPKSQLLTDFEARRYFRTWSRTSLAIPAAVVIKLEDGRIFTTGTAIVRDISLKGARLGRIVLKRQALPAASFRIHITFSSPEYEGIGGTCRPIRFGQGSEFELAVEFEDFWVRVDKKSGRV